MSSLPLVFEPNEILHTKASDVLVFDKKVQELAENMKDTMVLENGVGLAAPQIGQLLRMFVVAHKDGTKVFVNPRISSKSFRTNVDEEGCLSIPGVFGPVRRHNAILIEYQDEYGVRKKEKAKGFYARVIQHEYDHLEGVLFTEKLES